MYVPRWDLANWLLPKVDASDASVASRGSWSLTQ